MCVSLAGVLVAAAPTAVATGPDTAAAPVNREARSQTLAFVRHLPLFLVEPWAGQMTAGWTRYRKNKRQTNKRFSDDHPMVANTLNLHKLGKAFVGWWRRVGL